MGFRRQLVFYGGFQWLHTASKMEFEKASFWVRMFNLPLACMSETIGLHIGSSVGTVEDVETEEDGVGWVEYLRVKIWLDLSKPLARGRVLKIDGSTTWIAFQYETFPKFFFQCGVIRHGVAGCQGDPKKMEFRTWLRASPSYKKTREWKR